MHQRSFSRFLAPALLLLASAVPCQVVPLEAPTALRQGFGLDAATVQDLLLPPNGERGFEVEIVLGGANRTLVLTPHDVRSHDFQLLVDDGRTLRRLDTPASVTFTGHVRGIADSSVAASLVGGSLDALVSLAKDDLWGVQPANQVMPQLPASTHVVYRAADAPSGDVSCGTDHTAHAHDVPNNPGPQALKIAEIAIDADLEYYQRNGSNTTNVNNAVTSVINGMNVIYKRDVEIEHRITTILIRTTAVYTWNGDLCALLGEFRTRWNGNHSNIRRDLAHLFTGKGSFSGVVGCAYVSVVCTDAAYGASKVYASSATTNVGLVSHECGHNWSAGHCDSSPPCYIMCSGLGGCSGSLTRFGPTSINAIVAHKNSRGCLDNGPPPGPPTVSNIAPSSTTSWVPAPVTLTGTNLDAVTTVTVGGINATIGSKSPTSLTFTPPSPFEIATHPVVATNAVGSSSPVNLTITGNHPAVLVLGPVWFRGINAVIAVNSDRNWLSALFFSTSNTPSSLPGIISLGIGNNFSDLVFVGNVPSGTNGNGLKVVFVPLSIPAGTTLYWQAGSIDPGNPMLPIEVSNVDSKMIF